MLIKDSNSLVRDVSAYPEGSLVNIAIELPDYLDVTSLISLQKRMVDVKNITKRKLRLIGRTNSLDVEKTVQKMFIEFDDIYMTVLVDE